MLFSDNMANGLSEEQQTLPTKVEKNSEEPTGGLLQLCAVSLDRARRVSVVLLNLKINRGGQLNAF